MSLDAPLRDDALRIYRPHKMIDLIQRTDRRRRRVARFPFRHLRYDQFSAIAINAATEFVHPHIRGPFGQKSKRAPTPRLHRKRVCLRTFSDVRDVRDQNTVISLRRRDPCERPADECKFRCLLENRTFHLDVSALIHPLSFHAPIGRRG